MRRFVHGTLIGLLALSALAVLAVLAPVGETAAGPSPGQQAFEAQKCNMCHDVSSAGVTAKIKIAKMKGPDLTGVGARLDSDRFAQYMRKTIQLKGKDHKKEFKGTDEELQAMYGWLSEQKGE